MSKEESLNAIVEAIFAINKPKIDVSKKVQISTIIKTTVNGDKSIIDYLIRPVVGNESFVFGYILTNVRLIQLKVDQEGNITSGSYILNKIIGGVKRSLIDNATRIEARIEFSPDNTIVGIRYNINDKEFTDFFEKIEQTWIRGYQNV